MTSMKLQKYSDKIKNDLKALNHWPAILFIFDKIESKGRLCWLSGGAVRDLILGLTPLDIDFATDALEAEILELFPEAVLVGKEFGVYKIPYSASGVQSIYDLTVFREEDKYEDGRRPTVVTRSTPDKDAQRRDFTINALYWDLKKESLIDYVGGVEDLDKKIIRCVGPAAKRFQEDYLRVLRMLRFSYQLGFEIEAETYHQGEVNAKGLLKISGERIISEISKLKSHNSRLNFFKDELTVKIFEINGFTFSEIGEKIEKVRRLPETQTEQQALTEILFFIGFHDEAVEALQKRFKFSSVLKSWLLKLSHIQRFIDQSAEYFQYCLLIDKSEDYARAINCFAELGLLDDVLARHIIDTFNQHKIPLLEAKDIISLVPKNIISRTLSTVRIMQFQEKLSDFKSALNYVKNLDVRREENG